MKMKMLKLSELPNDTEIAIEDSGSSVDLEKVKELLKGDMN
ncbi:hypothetical protein Goe25_01260 [Bacillus phage vB_BsuM-Goe25]|nr:hypothetical protein Goe25_01260 [Bacillus phage vB_BsuM-Goe25]